MQSNSGEIAETTRFAHGRIGDTHASLGVETILEDDVGQRIVWPLLLDRSAVAPGFSRPAKAPLVGPDAVRQPPGAAIDSARAVEQPHRPRRSAVVGERSEFWVAIDGGPSDLRPADD